MWPCIHPDVSFTHRILPLHCTKASRYDIEQEVNGLYSFDRKEKIPAADVKNIIDSAMSHYFKYVVSK